MCQWEDVGKQAGCSHGMAGGRAAAVGCSIGEVARLRRMSRAVGALWAAVVGVGSRRCAAKGGLPLDARVRWGALIGIGKSFVQYFLVAARVNVAQYQSNTAESLIPYWVVRDRAVEIFTHKPFKFRTFVKTSLSPK